MEWEDEGGVEGRPPGLKEAIGTLRCEVVSSVPLRDMCVEQTEELSDSSMTIQGSKTVEQSNHQVAGSELFICQVLEVVPGLGEEPLLHLKQTYVGIGGLEG